MIRPATVRILPRAVLGFMALIGVLTGAASLPAAPDEGRSPLVLVSLAEERRIVVFRIEDEGMVLRRLSECQVDGEPGAIVPLDEGRSVAAALRGSGWLATFGLEDGSLRPTSRVPVDSNPAYLAPDRTERFLVSVDYSSNRIAVHRIDEQARLTEAGCRWMDTPRNPHAAVFDSANRFVHIPHTEGETILTLRFDPQAGSLGFGEVSRIDCEPGTGPRHLWIHPSLPVAYVSNEQGGSVGVYRMDRGTGALTLVQMLSTLPAGFDRRANACSHIEGTPDGRHLFVANRGHDSIACFAVEPGTGRLRVLGRTVTEATPRSFCLTPSGDRLIVVGEGSGALAVYRIGSTGPAGDDTPEGERSPLTLTSRHEVGRRPWWVVSFAPATSASR